MKKLFIALFTLILVFTCMPGIKTRAAEDNASWKHEGGLTWTLKRDDGTDITVKILGNTLYVTGVGAVPSYAYDALGAKPWNSLNHTIYEIFVYEGITSIGTKAFSDMGNLNKVTMYATTFLKDGSVFAGAKPECRFNFLGTNMSADMIGGKIPYTSLDSIVQFALSKNGKYTYVFANNYMTHLVKLKTGNKLANVVSSDDRDKTTNADYPYIDITTNVKKVAGDLHYLTAISIQTSLQGPNALAVIAFLMGDDNQYVGTYNISLCQNDKIIKNTDTPVTYSMDIPGAYRFPGRQFSLIQFGNGVVNVLADEDVNDNTITFTTDYPSTAYALIYRDAPQAVPAAVPVY